MKKILFINYLKAFYKEFEKQLAASLPKRLAAKPAKVVGKDIDMILIEGVTEGDIPVKAYLVIFPAVDYKMLHLSLERDNQEVWNKQIPWMTEGIDVSQIAKLVAEHTRFGL
jgi:hypothetical protein